MKINTRLIKITVLAAAFFAASCNNEPVIDETESPYLGNTLEVSGQQVWRHDRFAEKISRIFIPYKKSAHNLMAVVYMDIPHSSDPVPLASGSDFSGAISSDGILSFTVPDGIMDNKLIVWENSYCGEGCDYDRCDYMKCNYRYPDCLYHQCIDNHELYTMKAFFREWKNVEIDITSPDAIGNVVLLAADKNASGQMGALDRHGIYGTENSITCETIMYVYVKEDCRIKGKPDTGFIPDNYYYHTKKNLDLSLRRGWNLVSRTETYTTNFDGSAYIHMEIKKPIKNPEKFRWTISLNTSL